MWLFELCLLECKTITNLMEIAASFSSRNHASLLKRFDSTDRILDDIDAKLNGVTNSTSQ